MSGAFSISAVPTVPAVPGGDFVLNSGDSAVPAGTHRRPQIEALYGPPGTGKTTTLSAMVDDLVWQHGDEGVVIVSLTKAAAEEIRGRGITLPDTHVGTLHGICFRLLDMSRDRVADQHIDEFNKYQTEFRLQVARSREDSSRSDILQEYTLQRARMTPREKWPAHLRGFAASWERWKRLEGYLDFTDMIETCLVDRIGPPQHSVVGIADEAQDFSVLELELLMQWAESWDRTIFAFDDDQAIHTWRGADASKVLSLPFTERRTLEQSYRLPASIHAYSQRWIGRIRGPREEKPFRPREEPGMVSRRATLRYRSPQGIVKDVLATDGSAMILASAGYMLTGIIAELKEQGVPFHNPYRVADGQWNPLKSTAAAVAVFLQHPWTIGDVRQWVKLVKISGVLIRGDGKRRLDELPANVEAAPYMAEIFEDPLTVIQRDPDWLIEHAQTAKQKPIAYALRVAHWYGPEGLTTEPNLIVGTIHSVKGGQADTVWLLPDISRAAYLDEQDNILRVMYVGMTRARERLVLCGASDRTHVVWPTLQEAA